MAYAAVRVFLAECGAYLKHGNIFVFRNSAGMVKGIIYKNAFFIFEKSAFVLTVQNYSVRIYSVCAQPFY